MFKGEEERDLAHFDLYKKNEFDLQSKGDRDIA